MTKIATNMETKARKNKFPRRKPDWEKTPQNWERGAEIGEKGLCSPDWKKVRIGRI